MKSQIYILNTIQIAHTNEPYRYIYIYIYIYIMLLNNDLYKCFVYNDIINNNINATISCNLVT